MRAVYPEGVPVDVLDRRLGTLEEANLLFSQFQRDVSGCILRLTQDTRKLILMTMHGMACTQFTHICSCSCRSAGHSPTYPWCMGHTQLEDELQQLSQHADSARTTSSNVRERLGAYQHLLQHPGAGTPAGLLQLAHHPDPQGAAPPPQLGRTQPQQAQQKQAQAAPEPMRGASASAAAAQAGQPNASPGQSGREGPDPGPWTPVGRGVRNAASTYPCPAQLVSQPSTKGSGGWERRRCCPSGGSAVAACVPLCGLGNWLEHTLQGYSCAPS